MIGAIAARAAARSILAEGRFHQPSFPTPLHGVLNSVGHVLEAPLHGLEHLVDRVGAVIPGGVPLVWAALVVAVAVGSWLIARRLARSRLTGMAGVHGVRAVTAEELDRDAALAEGDGRFADAVRLRFRAGLMRLADRGRIPAGRAVATQEVSLTLGSVEFDTLARRFDEIAYGGADADADDAREQRDGWPRVLAGERR